MACDLGSFFAKGQADANFILFTIVSTAFIYFGRLAYIELRYVSSIKLTVWVSYRNDCRSVPVELGIRSRKLKELAIMTTICSSSFLTRSILQIFLSRESTQLHDRSTWFLLIVYYAVLEIIPCVTILYFNRRLPVQRRPGGSGANTPLGTGSNRLYFKHDDDGVGKGQGTVDPLRKSLLGSVK